MTARRVGPVISIASFIAIAVATLVPTPGTPIVTDRWCIACGELGGVDVAANIIMFIPLGFGLALATGRRIRTVLTCLVLTLIIESLQVSVVSGRDASLSDVVSNTLGGTIGALVAAHWIGIVRPTHAAARRLAHLATLAATVVLILTCFGLMPYPVPRQLSVQWAPPRAGYDGFTGELKTVEVDGLVLRPVVPLVAPGLSDSLGNRTWRVVANVFADTLQLNRAVILRFANDGGPIFSMEQRYDALTCQRRVWANRFRFRSPRAALDDALLNGAENGRDEVRLLCGRSDGQMQVGVVRAGTETTRSLPLSPSLGWLMLSPFDLVDGDVLHIMGALWLGGLLFPAGYWSAMSARASTAVSRRRRGVSIYAVAVVALVVGLAIAPRLARIASASWWEWSAAISGIVLGSLTALLVERLWPDSAA